MRRPYEPRRKVVMEIEDAGYTKPVDLDAAQLRNGSILFTNASKDVHFRLIVYPEAHASAVSPDDGVERAVAISFPRGQRTGSAR